jgi:hypothetical protein
MKYFLLLTVLQHYPAIFAQTFPLYYAPSKEKKDLGMYICETFLPTFVGAEVVNQLIPKELDTILIKLLDLTKIQLSGTLHWRLMSMRLSLSLSTAQIVTLRFAPYCS